MNTINLSELSNTFQAWQSCTNSENKAKNQFAEIHEDRINKILENLPSGSGIDNGIKFDWQASKRDRLVFTFGFHHMNENGYYDGWTEHQLILTPSFLNGYDMRITGRDRNNVKDYLYDTFAFTFVLNPDYHLQKA